MSADPAVGPPGGADRQPPPAFEVMLKPGGARCNLACRYCYYLGKEALYPGHRLRMTEAVLERFTRQYVDAQRLPAATFVWQGGEPTLMGLEFLERAVQLQQRYRRPGMRIDNALQTNATLLDEEWCRFLKQHGFLVGVSLDGPAALHDAYRVDRGGRPTFERVMAGLALLQEHGVEHNVLATVHAANAGRPLEVYRFLRDRAGARFVQFIPIVERDAHADPRSGRLTARSVSGAQYGQFLIAVFDEWLRRDVGRVFVQTFDAALGAWLGGQPSLCVHRETCGLGLVLEHSGDLYSCDHFVEPRHCLGNINERPLVELVASSRQQRFGLAKRETLPGRCRACPVLPACNGGCPKDRLVRLPGERWAVNVLCEGYRAFFGHIDRPMRAMATTLRAGGRQPL